MTDTKADELLKKAKELDARAKAGHEKATVAEASSPLQDIKEINDTIKTTKRGYTNAKTMVMAVYDTAIKPVWDFVAPVCKGVADFYKKHIWQRFAYKTDKATGTRKLSKKRVGVILTATFAAAAACTPTTIGAIARGVTVDPALAVAHEIMDAGRLATHYNKDEILYLNRESQTSIDRQDGTYMVKGCKTETCDASNSIYFVIKDSFVNSVWNQVENGSMLYNTHQIAAAIPTGAVARCEVTNYGARIPLFLYMGSKPILLEAKCSNLESSFQEAAAPAKTEAQQVQPAVKTPSAVLPSGPAIG